MHPTRTGAPGTRPMGVGPGLPPPGTTRPGARPGGPSRRPGQRYVPRGVKEGPMKGFTPPPRLSLSNEPLPITRAITISEGVSVKDLAGKLEIRAKDLIARLLAKGVFATINQTLDAELAIEMARFFGAETSVITFEEQTAKDIAASNAGEEGAATEGLPRPPVVTIMGHVDHGKTTLLDSIRSTNVAGGEAGGITQHIGAYKVSILDKNSPAYGREIVFLDTPGHEAFTRMRSRGAKATDIVVLVTAADDGVMPQTIEAIDHAHAAEVPIIVAVNKIDKPGALPERVKKQLADRGLLPEEWGGKTVFVDVSAKQKTNLNLLMEMILLTADLQELKATPGRAANGVVLEAKLDRGRGPVGTILVQNGTLRAGDNFVVGNAYGKVRAMFDDRGKSLQEAPPSTPVERQSAAEVAAVGHWRDHRDGCAAGVGVECHHHWIQRASGAQGAGTGRTGKSRHTAALDHLRTAGRDQARHDRAARADDQRNLSGTRRCAGDLPHSKGGDDCRLPRERWTDQARFRGAASAR